MTYRSDVLGLVDQKVEVAMNKSHIEKERQFHYELCHVVEPTKDGQRVGHPETTRSRAMGEEYQLSKKL